MRVPKLLFVVTEDWYFWSHRRDLARAAAQAGFDVSIATRVTDHGERIQREGFRLFPIGLFRRGRNPFVELTAVLELVRLYRRERPAIVHHVAMKPVLYGLIAARLAGVRNVVNAPPGLGHVFAADGLKARLIRMFVRLGLTWVLKG